jgi:Na+-transporting methylmalonyl-CoA/oxaloacetate decarboxylase gamma subunit
MPSLNLGSQFMVTGMVIVFITLIIMSVSMWLVGLLVKRKKKVKTTLKGLKENEIMALTLAIHQYRSEKEEIALEFEEMPNWSMRGRIESLEQSQ